MKKILFLLSFFLLIISSVSAENCFEGNVFRLLPSKSSYAVIIAKDKVFYTVILPKSALLKSKPAKLPVSQLRAGDYVKIYLDKNMLFLAGEVITDRMSDYVLAKGRNKLLLKSGLLLYLHPEVSVQDEKNKKIKITEVNAGDKVNLSLNPVTRHIWAIEVVSKSKRKTTDTIKPSITSLTVKVIKTIPVTLEITLIGTEKGKALVRLPWLKSELPVKEIDPQIYQTHYQLPASVNLSDFHIIGLLIKGKYQSVPYKTYVKVK